MADRRGGLSPAVIAWRSAHGLITSGFLLSIAYVWWCALTGRRGLWLGVSAGALALEGALVILNRGDCPLAPIGDRVGDPVPFFELVLTQRQARYAIPVLGVVAAAGGGVLIARSGGRGEPTPAA